MYLSSLGTSNVIENVPHHILYGAVLPVDLTRICPCAIFLLLKLLYLPRKCNSNWGIFFVFSAAFDEA